MDIKREIIGKQRCFHLSVTPTNTQKVFGYKPIDECLFFLQRDDNNLLVFCRMKLPNEITADDFFKFSESTFDEYIANGEIELL